MRSVYVITALITTLFVRIQPVYAGTNNTFNATAELGTTSPTGSIIGLILTLLVIVVLAIATIKYLGRKTQVKQTGSIQILAARQLAPNRFVEVIEVEGKRYLVGVGDQVTLLADVTEDFPAVGTVAENGATFSTTFTQALEVVRKKYGRPTKSGGDEQ